MQAEALLEQLAGETRHVLAETLHRLRIVSQAAVDNSQIALHRNRETHLLQVRSYRQGALTERKGAVQVTHVHKMGEQMGCHPPQSVLVTQGLGTGIGVLQGDQVPLQLTQGPERIAQRQA